MNCPKCQTATLAQFKVEGVAVDRCSTCAGTWFDVHELGQLLAEDARQVAALTRGASDQSLDQKRGRCPRDGADLLRIYSAIDRGVVLDACADCHGIWLDGGEFAKLLAARRP